MRAAEAGDVPLMQLLIDKGAAPLRALENGTTISERVASDSEGLHSEVGQSQ
jgi:hypothetical protein